MILTTLLDKNHSMSGKCLLFLMITLVSCQATKELHYIKEGDNYYRLKIKQHSFLSSSRYMSGYFDPAAVDAYFGDVKKSEVQSNIAVLDKKSGKCSGGRELVLILSSNSDAVAQEITSISDNAALFSLLQGLANQDKLLNQKLIEHKIDKILGENANMVLKLEKLLDDLSTNKKSDAIKNMVTDLLK